MTNFDLEVELGQELGPGEKFIWTGKPRTGIIFRSSDIFMIPFSLLWGGFALFWETSVVTTGGPFFFMIWGIPFVVVGLYMIVGRFFLDARKRRDTVYGLTPDRIIIKSGIFNRSITSLNIKTLTDITINQKADNSGTITLGPNDMRYLMMQGIDLPGAKQPPRLELINDVKNVYDIIIDLQRQAQKNY